MGRVQLYITQGTLTESNLFFFNTDVFKIGSLTNHQSNGWPYFPLLFSLSSGLSCYTRQKISPCNT